MADAETLRVYDQRAQDYVATFKRKEVDPDLVRFMDHLPKDAHVLDVGCGPGAAAAIMKERGFIVDAIDASAEMVRLARQLHGVSVRQIGFDEVAPDRSYGGIWANFSLLHAPRAAVPAHIGKFADALVSGGVFHIGMKVGTGEARDDLGRFYSYFEVHELRALLEAAGLSILAQTTGEDAGLAGTVDPWITLLARKPM